MAYHSLLNKSKTEKRTMVYDTLLLQPIQTPSIGWLSIKQFIKASTEKTVCEKFTVLFNSPFYYSDIGYSIM